MTSSAPTPCNAGAPDASETITIRVVDRLSAVDKDAWDAVANPPDAPYNPFVSWNFLEALEQAGCAAPRQGWGPRHVLAEDASGALIGAAPTYLKGHSQGEFVFDHAWANAYEHAGGRYYPKLQVCSPFTPVTGPRVLAPTTLGREAVLAGLVDVAERMGVSSLHVTFPTEPEWRFAGEHGLLQRQDSQFHWRNRGYAAFDDFLGDLASRKRKNLKKERAAAQDGVEIVRIPGPELTDDHWDAFYRFYVDTGDRKWGSPYLNRLCFALLQERMAEDILMILARRNGEWIAGALNFIGGDALYGRYWGRLEDRPFLHFEICYYQAIDAALELGLPRVEAGAQGGHKMARGYAPEPVYSYHWIAEPGFRAAVADYLERERRAVDHEIEALTEMTPFKRGG